MRTKKIPMRMCVGCGQMKPKSELIRIVKSPDGTVSLGDAKQQGRGAYVCRSADCLKKAKSNKRLERAFSEKIEDAVYERLEGEIINGE